ncbi:hypothetical protein L3Q82_011414 [Scortum barcoo]|uniref:Uncharacterized protein n=1 Tax=Scortum barcoo TaxID=214431 RepID=A0ACB8WAE5_9TELE|nr:hypothetical protein L3Q82_011414 [Scortum barcoo]
MQKYFIDEMPTYNVGQIESIAEELLPELDAKGHYYARTFTRDGQALVIVKTPTKIKTKADVLEWLTWWVKQLNTTWAGCNIEALISPNKKYDAVVKMTANVLGIESILENPRNESSRPVQGTQSRGPPGTWGQQTGAQATPPKPKPKPAAGPRTGEHLPDEEYRKLTPEQKKALREDHYDLITTRDLKELQLPKKLRRSLRRRLDKLQARVVRLEPAQSKATQTNWYKPVDVTETTEQKIQESDFSPKGKERLKQIIAQANVARFKNDCGDLGGKYVHTIEGGVHPPVRQYPLNPGSCGGDGQDSEGAQLLNRRTIANRASLINPQGALKTLQVKKYKSCIDLANGFFSLETSQTVPRKDSLHPTKEKPTSGSVSHRDTRIHPMYSNQRSWTS